MKGQDATSRGKASLWSPVSSFGAPRRRCGKGDGDFFFGGGCKSCILLVTKALEFPHTQHALQKVYKAVEIWPFGVSSLKC